jgi:hypothetical protein
MRKSTAQLIWLLAAVLVPVPASAQAWDAPSFFSPRPGEDVGLYAFTAEATDDWGFAAIWRQSGNINLGVRAGIVGRDHIILGAEFYRPFDLLGPGSGLLMSWAFGVGASFNEVTTLRVPLGISVGAALGTAGGVQLMPYVHPRVAFQLAAYDLDGRERTVTSGRLDIDIGADAAIGPSFVLRVGATLGETTTFGAGAAYRLQRRLIVR